MALERVSCTSCASAGLGHSCELDIALNSCKRCLQTQGECSYLSNSVERTMAMLQAISDQQDSLLHEIELLSARLANMALETEHLEWYERILSAQADDSIRTGHLFPPLITRTSLPGRRHKFVVYIL
ncbi:hypothetical protein PGT21_029558 [Puccinia graminis f. sp. tritici]|uniref:Zn(2)-C6 fungal-type domain-containing protein n=1 Tax=Puccinia graminis f. sp. tritici TaxID=56615 RepID=A0A5B0PYX9_PUCGR|nr:hypothetical protein PGT21_029558 [Puccinia graminis f. sp. tritici]KAA1109188.1 hypothetical protein PGTUg99_013878 [Puccinia graminis f. sp. tritici]